MLQSQLGMQAVPTTTRLPAGRPMEEGHARPRSPTIKASPSQLSIAILVVVRSKPAKLSHLPFPQMQRQDLTSFSRGPG